MQEPIVCKRDHKRASWFNFSLQNVFCCQDSILDIKVPIFKGPGEMPEIRSYMEEFPFPFYIILRDVNALPETLSDALRQWFELVTASDHP